MSEAGALRMVFAVALTAAVTSAAWAIGGWVSGIVVAILAVVAGFVFELRHMRS